MPAAIAAAPNTIAYCRAPRLGARLRAYTTASRIAQPMAALARQVDTKPSDHCAIGSVTMYLIVWRIASISATTATMTKPARPSPANRECSGRGPKRGIVESAARDPIVVI